MFDHNIKDIGLYTRPSTQGDELDLVEDFIEYYKELTQTYYDLSLSKVIESQASLIIFLLKFAPSFDSNSS